MEQNWIKQILSCCLGKKSHRVTKSCRKLEQAVLCVLLHVLRYCMSDSLKTHCAQLHMSLRITTTQSNRYHTSESLDSEELMLSDLIACSHQDELHHHALPTEARLIPKSCFLMKWNIAHLNTWLTVFKNPERSVGEGLPPSSGEMSVIWDLHISHHHPTRLKTRRKPTHSMQTSVAGPRLSRYDWALIQEMTQVLHSW